MNRRTKSLATGPSVILLVPFLNQPNTQTDERRGAVVLMKKQFLILLFLNLINSLELGRYSNKKSVRFQDNIEEEPTDSASSDYFTFGVPKKKKKSRPSSSSHYQKSMSSSKQENPKLKSALKSTNKKPLVIASSSGVKSNGGAFDISSYRSNDPNVKAFIGDASSINARSKNGLYDDSDMGPYVPDNPFRNIGPTPEIIDAVSPERFWLPPNAPITQNIPGPFLPYAQGVPGQMPVDNSIRVDEFYLPQVQGLTGPRDFDLPVDTRTPAEILAETGIATVDPYVPPYQPPLELTPLNPVTPIPGGNIIDPLSPQVNNIRGPFFPDEPRNDGAYLVTADLPPPQLVARDIDDGPYIVERVTDPIVFFDPVQGQTVVFDPLRNFTRLYNPETDPELPLEDPNVNSGTVAETGGVAAIPIATGRINGGLLKSMNSDGPSRPAFWILKKLDDLNLKDYEKSGGINGQQIQAQAARSSNGARNGHIIYQKCDINPLKPPPLPQQTPKKQHISVKKPAKVQPGNPEPNPENIRIQLTSANPNEQEAVGDGHEKRGKIDNKEKENKSSKTSKGEKNNYKVTLVYRPIVDIDIEKRYSGFKANSNHKNEAGSWTKPSISTVSVSLLILFVSLIL